MCAPGAACSNAALTQLGLIGRLRMRTPVASKTALPIAGAIGFTDGSPEPVAERISVPYFFNPRLDAQVPVLSLPDELRARAERRHDPSDPIFSVYGRNAWKSRLRAHPDVAAAHGYSAGTGDGAAPAG